MKIMRIKYYTSIKYRPVKFEDPDEIISIDLSIPFPSRRGKNRNPFYRQRRQRRGKVIN